MDPVVRSLVLYKGQPALVLTAAKKLAIQLADGGTLDVRPKDVELLHPGPVTTLSQLTPPPGGEVQTAWELLQGTSTTIPELAELVYGEFTPATAWATWELVADGRQFSGTPDEIAVHDLAAVAAIDERREAKAAEAASWDAFTTLIAEGRNCDQFDESALGFVAEVERLALGQSETSRVLQELGHAQTAESAHAFLLSAGCWTPATNPYPARAGVPAASPEMDVPALPDEPRRDLTHLIALAIDDEGSSDPDDAISVEGDCLWVHIADAAALVTPGSPLDEEARSRGANLYLPEGTSRMLPDVATDQLALGLQETSPALSFRLTVDEAGRPSLVELTPSWVRVRRTTYEDAESELTTSPLEEIAAICRRNQARRLTNGAVEIELPEVKVKVDAAGRVAVRPLPPLRSRELVREAMLITGEAVGRFAAERDIPLPYTAQSPPRGEIGPLSGPASMFAVRKLMQRSQQQTTHAPHSGLGLELYVQATSPLRRYLDLVSHQQLRRHLLGQPLLAAAEITLAIGATAAVLGSVRWAERLSIVHWKLNYLLQNPDWQGEGIVVEHRGRRDLVLIPDLAWEQLMNAGHGELDAAVMLAAGGVDLPNLSAAFRKL